MTSGRLARSHLFAPGDNAKLLSRVFQAGADAVVLDLEDAVAAGRKDEARRLVAEAIAAWREPGPLVSVRINGTGSRDWEADLEAVALPGLHLVRVAKTESAATLAAVAVRLDALEAARGIAAGTIGLVPTVESAAGVVHALELAHVPRVRAFAFGATDFLRDIGAPRGAGDTETLHARSHLVLVSRVAGLQPPIASVHTQIDDLEGLRRTTDAARLLGFFGRSCIHPRQVPIVNEAFTPSAGEIEEAKAVVDAAARGDATGTASLVLPGGQFVDRAVVDRARAVLALSEAIQAQAEAVHAQAHVGRTQ